ncbi:MAG: OsmC family protein, partial [Candidatus Omnitrophica bacterium]|nr:OsmC family protein [Candidatus Omnitrophota bacterium]
VCIMTTFLYYAERENLRFLSYESSAEGILEKGERGLIFSSIEVVPEISVKSVNDIEKTRDLLALSEKNCLISNSIKSKVTVRPEIQVNKENNQDG